MVYIYLAENFKGVMMQLDQDQQLVANVTDNTLVIALAGAGKTATLVALTAKLISENDKSCLLVTFTRAAANELLGRVKAAIPNHLFNKVKVSTFDALFSEIYKDNFGSDYTLLLGSARDNFIARVLRNTKFKNDNFEIKLPQAIGLIDRLQLKLASTAKTTETDEALALYNQFKRYAKRYKVVDFNMIAQEVTTSLIQGKVDTIEHDYLLVDEYQDTNSVQYNWIVENGKSGVKTIVCGDDDQAIYSFRGSSGYENMMNFQSELNAKAYLLKTCYRCQPEILEAANQVISFNRERIVKKMQSAKSGGGVFFLKNYGHIENEINAILNSVAHAPSGWAILARSNRELDLIETGFKTHNVTYERRGGKRFWDNQYAIIVLKFLWSCAMDNTKYLSEILGFLHEDEEVIFQLLTELKHQQFSHYVPSGNIHLSVRTEQLHRLWCECQYDLNEKYEIETRLRELQHLLINAHGLNNYQRDMIVRVFDIVSQSVNEHSFHELIHKLSKNLEPQMKQQDESKNHDVVVLSTLHASKGLQWKKVWIFDLVQGKCPSQIALDSGDIEEERRLLYVGMTRAEQELYVTSSYMNNEGSHTDPSEFLLESFGEPETWPQTLIT